MIAVATARGRLYNRDSSSLESGVEFLILAATPMSAGGGA